MPVKFGRARNSALSVATRWHGKQTYQGRYSAAQIAQLPSYALVSDLLLDYDLANGREDYG